MRIFKILTLNNLKKKREKILDKAESLHKIQAMFTDPNKALGVTNQVTELLIKAQKLKIKIQEYEVEK
jgi:hypothetical protein